MDTLTAPRPLTQAMWDQVPGVCRQFRVRKLDVFGSALTPAFDPLRSDIDLLVTFGDIPEREVFDAYFDLKEALESLFNRRIDLVVDHEFSNPYVRRGVEATRRPLFREA